MSADILPATLGNTSLQQTSLLSMSMSEVNLRTAFLKKKPANALMLFMQFYIQQKKVTH